MNWKQTLFWSFSAAAIFYYNDISEGKLTKMYQKYAFLYESNVSVISV